MSTTFSAIYEEAIDNEVTLSLLLTEKCNFQCDHCMYFCGPHKSGKYMSMEIMRKVIGWCRILELYNLRPEINLIGGEPTLPLYKFERAFDFIMGYSDEYKIEMTTNGWWLEKPKALRKFLDIIGYHFGDEALSIRVSNDNYHSEFRKNKVEFMFDDYFGEEGFGLYDAGIYSEYDEEPYNLRDAVKENRFYVEKSWEDRGTNNVGRAFKNGIGVRDAGLRNACYYRNTISILPNGKSSDGCCFGSNLPFGSINDNPLVLLLLNKWFFFNVRSKSDSCVGCDDLAYEWRRSRDFLKVRKLAKEFVNKLELQSE